MTINEIEDELKKRTVLELLVLKSFIVHELDRRQEERGGKEIRKDNKT